MKRLFGFLLLLGVLGCGPKNAPSTGNKDESTPNADVAAIQSLMSRQQLALGGPTVNSIGMVFVPIPAGEFMMGYPAPAPKHSVKITQSFHLGAFEVTQEQYEEVMGDNPSQFKGAQNPVENVSWDDAVEFCRRVSELPEEKSAGHEYRLPTEAEWEYACRAGTTTAYSFGDDDSPLGEFEWYSENSQKSSHPVGEKKPNPWGLYDIHGNVSELCQDWFGGYPADSVTDPTGPSAGSARVTRGSSWRLPAKYCRSGVRGQIVPSSHTNDPPDRGSSVGFRVVRGPSASKPVSGTEGESQ